MRDDFNFPIVNFPFLSSKMLLKNGKLNIGKLVGSFPLSTKACNIPSAPANGVYVC